jgi:hypothetical protein
MSEPKQKQDEKPPEEVRPDEDELSEIEQEQINGGALFLFL